LAAFMKSALIANGQIDDLQKLLPLIQEHDRIVAVDGGLKYCKKGNFSPVSFVGDFDSCPKDLFQEFSKLPSTSLQSDKDQTDLEVAIENEWKQGAKEITLFGAWGNRIDHSLTNALLLGRYPNKLRLQTETELLFAIQGKVKISPKKGQTISLIPLFGPAKGIHTTGLKWELKNGRLDYGFIGISNISLTKEVVIEIEEGILLVCQGLI